jgi:hypothetical protein
MHIVDKLNLQLDTLIKKIELLNSEKKYLIDEIENLQNEHDILKRNNENMLLNIDKALCISRTKQEVDDDISN